MDLNSIHEIEKLLGGYATGTLSEPERQLLFRAAIGNQSLFDALADEEALRELFADPAARKRLLAAVAPPPSLASRISAWIWHPIPVGAVCAAVAVLTFVALRPDQKPAAESTARIALREVARNDAPEKKPPAPPLAPAKKGKTATAARAPVRTVAPPPEREARLNQAPAPKQESARQESLKKDAEAKATVAAEAMTASTPARPALPLRYQIERRQDGRWVDFGGELSAGDEVRLRVTANDSGYVSLSVAGMPSATFTQRVEGGQTYYLPASRSLPNSAGDRILLLSLSGSPPFAAAIARPKAFRGVAPGAVGGAIDNSERARMADEKMVAPYATSLRLVFR